jgi:hypothetical protein
VNPPITVPIHQQFPVSFDPLYVFFNFVHLAQSIVPISSVRSGIPHDWHGCDRAFINMKLPYIASLKYFVGRE